MTPSSVKICRPEGFAYLVDFRLVDDMFSGHFGVPADHSVHNIADEWESKTPVRF